MAEVESGEVAASAEVGEIGEAHPVEGIDAAIEVGHLYGGVGVANPAADRHVWIEPEGDRAADRLGLETGADKAN